MRNLALALLLTLALGGAAWADPVVLQSGNTQANCHGYTFTGGNAVVDQFPAGEGRDNVGQVIHEGYDPVADPTTARPGDIIVYDDPGAPSHTGLVVGVQDGRPVVVSKWGQQGDVKLHDPGEYGHADDGDWKIFRRRGGEPDPEADAASRDLLDARARGDEAACREAARRLVPLLQRLNMARGIRLRDVQRSTSFHEQGSTFYVQGNPAGCGVR